MTRARGKIRGPLASLLSRTVTIVLLAVAVLATLALTGSSANTNSGPPSQRPSGTHLLTVADTNSGPGYWLASTAGGVSSFGTATGHGSAAAMGLRAPTVGMASTSDGAGYWMASSDGGVFSFGDASFYGSAGSIDLKRPIVGMASTTDGRGYWLVASDGGIFSFGDASFFGSTGAMALNKPIVGMASTPDGRGYWLVASDGGIFSFGDASFFGSMGGSGTFHAAAIVPVGRSVPAPPLTVPPPTTAPTTTPTTTPPTEGSTPAPFGVVPGSGLEVPRVVGNQLVGSSGQPIRLLGVDASGTEDACTLGHSISWGPFDAVEASSIASWHTNAVRVPLNEDCWLGINGVPPQLSGAAYQNQIKSWVADLNAAGLVAILDLHWSAPGTTEALQQWPMADADHSITFWSQVAATFKSDPSVIFDLFNEPYLGQGDPTAADWSCWRDGCLATAQLCPGTYDAGCASGTSVTFQVAGMQQMLDAVRLAGADQPVMVGGLNWAGDPCGVRDYGGSNGTCAWLSYEPADPAHQLVVSLHTYNWTACNTAACWNDSVAPVASQAPVVTGEFGERDCSATYADQFMDWADQYNISYLAWSWQPTSSSPTGCGATNLGLLAGWDGSPSATNPVGSALATHLSQLSRGGS
jgi:endoglucanase